MNASMDNLTVRVATVGDLDVLVWLRVDLQRHVQSCSPRMWRRGENELRQEVSEMIADVDGRTMLAVVAKRIVGFAYGKVLRRSTEIHNIVGSIQAIFVEEEYRNRGVGSQLAEELCSFFASQNVEEVTLRYAIGNKEAERFWSSRGFVPVIAVANTILKEFRDKNHSSYFYQR
jgi:GNAT superfamily N-acetyltransferase